MEMFERIRNRRLDLGMTQDELAKAMSYSDRSTIAKIESGKNDISQAKIRAFAAALHTTPSYLMGITDDPYDYDRDEEGRFSQIPSQLLQTLIEIEGEGNMADVWNAWLDVKDNPDVIAARQPGNVIPMPRVYEIPLLGAIACGEPILAAENIDGTVEIPEHIRADFALRCKGDSMIGDRIEDGDIVYIRQQPSVDNGQIAAVLIGDEATLKHVYIKPNSIVLQPANPQYDPMVYVGEECESIRVLGKAVGFTSALE